MIHRPGRLVLPNCNSIKLNEARAVMRVLPASMSAERFCAQIAMSDIHATPLTIPPTLPNHLAPNQHIKPTNIAPGMVAPIRQVKLLAWPVTFSIVARTQK